MAVLSKATPKAKAQAISAAAMPGTKRQGGEQQSLAAQKKARQSMLRKEAPKAAGKGGKQAAEEPRKKLFSELREAHAGIVLRAEERGLAPSGAAAEQVSSSVDPVTVVQEQQQAPEAVVAEPAAEPPVSAEAGAEAGAEASGPATSAAATAPPPLEAPRDEADAGEVSCFSIAEGAGRCRSG